MAINKENIRLILGLKVRQFRQDKGMSFKALSQATGMSVSYLNEIERGKKYPKAEKIIRLAEALDISYDELVSLKVSKKLAPVAALLNSGILHNLPVSIFGVETSTVLELISKAPANISAFISTILKIARNYEMRREHFYFASLRSFQEMHDNYFGDLEEEAEKFVEAFRIETEPPLSEQSLRDILHQNYGYKIDDRSLDEDEDLKHFRCILEPKSKTLYLNANLTQNQRIFQLAREIGFSYLKPEIRPYTATLFQVNSFEEVLNNFKVSYFAISLLMNRNCFLEDMTRFFSMPRWDTQAFLDFIHRYQVSPEIFAHRLTSLLTQYFGISSLFFLRFNKEKGENKNFELTTEMHLHRLHNPHGNELNEHYCRRWVSTRIIHDFEAETGIDPEMWKVEVQRSVYNDTKNEYFCISIARTNKIKPNTIVSATVGIQIDQQALEKIAFLRDHTIPQQVVGTTCERCLITDCTVRVAPSKIVDKAEQDERIQRKLSAFLKDKKHDRLSEKV